MRLTLRPYQQEALDGLLNWFYDNREGNPLLVVPTGAGKSLILAEWIRKCLKSWPESRFLVATHVAELVDQNYQEFVRHWFGGDPPFGAQSPATVYSAGLKSKNASGQVVFASIQSIYRKVHKLGKIHILLVDEAHMVPKTARGRYHQFLADMRKLNPRVRVVGLTATHYRLDGGYLHRGKHRLFDAVAYEVPVEELVPEYLAPLVSRRAKTSIDTGGLRSRGGDFKLEELAERAMKGNCMVAEAVQEVVTVAREEGRKSWLVFGITIAHAEEILAALRALDVNAELVHGKTPMDQRRELVEAFRYGRITAMVNVGVLTTGFNAPRIDLIALMRPTQSTGLYVQMMGRGMRLFPGKENCRVLDYGGNVRRHGPITHVSPVRGDGDPGDGPAPTRVCPQCQEIDLISRPICRSCGFEFPKQEVLVDHATRASDLPIMGLPPDETLYPRQWWPRLHHKPGKPPSVRVDYVCGIRLVPEWVFPEHSTRSARQVARWWQERGGSLPAPPNAESMINRWGELTMPFAIRVGKEKKRQGHGFWDRVKGIELRAPQAEPPPSKPTLFAEIKRPQT